MDTLSHLSGEPDGSSDSVPQRSAWDIFLLPWRKLSAGAARWRLFFVACLLLICGTTAFIGIVPTWVFGHDNFFLLDNGWRVFCGQRPHLDFYSPWGPLTFLIVALGLLISNASPNAIGYGSAIVGLLIGLWAYRLGRNRLEAAPRILLGLYLALLVTAPYPLGTSPLLSTHAMVYNRYGFALVGLVLLECLQRSQGREENADERWGGISTGVAMALVLFLKASYFSVCVPIVGASLVYRGLNRRRLGGLAAGFGVVALMLLAYLRFDVLRIGQDLWMAAVARSKSLSRLKLMVDLSAQAPFLAVVIALSLYGTAVKKEARRWWEEQQLLIWGLLIFIADAAVVYSNMQVFGMPLLGVFGIVVASRMIAERRRMGGAEAGTEKQRYIFVLLLCGFLSLPQFCLDLVGLGYGAFEKAHPSAAMSRVRFSVPRLRPMILYDGPSGKHSNWGVYTAHINEGIALLKQYCGPGDRVLNLDMVNPFPYAMGWRPAHGGMAAAAYNCLFTDELRPSDDAYFGDTTVVLVPKEPALEPRYYDGYYRIYHPALLERFRLAAESESWRLYKLK
jgi:hypothetical protein